MILPHLNSNSTIFFLNWVIFQEEITYAIIFLKLCTKTVKNDKRLAVHELSSEKFMQNN